MATMSNRLQSLVLFPESTNVSVRVSNRILTAVLLMSTGVSKNKEFPRHI